MRQIVCVFNDLQFQSLRIIDLKKDGVEKLEEKFFIRLSAGQAGGEI